MDDREELEEFKAEGGVDEWPLPDGWKLPTLERPVRPASTARRTKAAAGAAKKVARESRRRENRYLKDLHNLVNSIRTPTDYPAVRERYLSLNEALNKMNGVPALMFRPAIPRALFGKSPEGEELFIDQQLIDMHWLVCRGCKPEVSAGLAFLSLQKSGVLGADARKFAALQWKMPAKVAAMNATPLQRFGCIWLLDGELRKKRKTLINAANRHRRRLLTERSDGTSAERRSLERIDLDRVASAWLARELVRLTGAPLSDARVANYFSLITGEPASRNGVGNQLRQVEKHIDVRSEPIV